MINNSDYSQEVRGRYELHDIASLPTPRNCANDNAILIPTWCSRSGEPTRAPDPRA